MRRRNGRVPTLAAISIAACCSCCCSGTVGISPSCIREWLLIMMQILSLSLSLLFLFLSMLQRQLSLSLLTYLFVVWILLCRTVTS